METIIYAPAGRNHRMYRNNENWNNTTVDFWKSEAEEQIKQNKQLLSK